MFLLQLIISFLAGGLFIALQTLIAERVKGAWRGIVLTIPSTMALGIFFVGIVKSSADVVEATRIIPAALGPDYLFVAIFALLARFGFFISLAGGFLTWAAGAALLFFFPPASFLTSTFLYGIPPICLGYLLIKSIAQETELKKFPMTPAIIATRSLIGGSIIALIVFLANTAGNFWAGLFSAFPAAFTSTFIIYYKSQGRGAIPHVACSMFFPGAIGFMIYAWIAALTFPAWGVWLGTLASYIGTALYFWLWTEAKQARVEFFQ